MSEPSGSRDSQSSTQGDYDWQRYVFGGGEVTPSSARNDPPASPSRGSKRTHTEMSASLGQETTPSGGALDVANDGPPPKRATTDAAGEGVTVPGSKYALRPDEQAAFEDSKWKELEEDEKPTPEELAYSLPHFDPNYDYIADPEDSPPRALTWWDKVAAKFRPGLRIRDINFDQFLPTDDKGEPIPTKHPRWWLPDGDIVVNIDNHLFRLHKDVIMPHLLFRKFHFDALSSGRGPWYTDGKDKLPIMNWTCVHHEDRQNARYLARLDATGRGWAPGSEEETALLVKGLAEFDHDEATGRSKCRCPTARDFSLVCQMIYSPRTFFNRGPIFFDDLERMLHLSEHYHSLRLRACAIAGLKMLFPTTLEHHRRYTRNNAVRLVPATYAIDTLHLCLRYNIRDVLLIAMYTLSNYDHRFLIHGIFDPTRNHEWKLVAFDSTVTIGGKVVRDVGDTRRLPKPLRLLDLQPWQLVYFKSTLEKNREERLKAAEEHRLPKIDLDPAHEQREMLACILKGRAHMQTARRDILFGFLQDIPSFPDELGKIPDDIKAEYDCYGYKYSEGCKSVSMMDVPQLDSISCATALKALMTEFGAADARRFTNNRLLPKPRDALRAFSSHEAGEWGDEEDWRGALCSSCLTKFKFEMKRGQQELWSRLPEFFGWKSWFDIEMEDKRTTEYLAGYWMKDAYDPEKGAEGGLLRPDSSYLDFDLSARRAQVKKEKEERAEALKREAELKAQAEASKASSID